MGSFTRCCRAAAALLLLLFAVALPLAARTVLEFDPARQPVRLGDAGDAWVDETGQARVEDVAGTFDCITARAFASLGEMLGWGGHLLAPDGVWLAMKGRAPEDELDAVPREFRVEKVVTLNVPGLDAERHLVILKRSASSVAPANAGS